MKRLGVSSEMESKNKHQPDYFLATALGDDVFFRFFPN